MSIIKKLLATLGLCFLLVVLPASALSDARLLDDHRFITSDELIGMTAEEVSREIGPPQHRGACSVGTSIGGQTVKVDGRGWAYRAVFETGMSHLSICFVKGRVVAEQRISARISKDGRYLQMASELIDHRVLQNVLEEDPDRPAWIDPKGPEI